MFITVINDCQDGNAAGRQLTRLAHLFKVAPTFIGVAAFNELEAAGNLIDALDAGEAGEGVVLVNVAPRHGRARQWPNGTPFGYFYVRHTLVVASLDGLTLSLVKKLGLAPVVRRIDLPETTGRMVAGGELPAKLREHIIRTQFRSFDYLPRVARFLWDYDEKVGEEMVIQEFDDAPPAVWWVDNFGNCKTTLTARDLPEGAAAYATRFGELPVYGQLRDVPDGQAALVTGSSGFLGDRFLELVVQGGSAAERFGLRSGDSLL